MKNHLMDRLNGNGRQFRNHLGTYCNPSTGWISFNPIMQELRKPLTSRSKRIAEYKENQLNKHLPF